MPRLKPKIKRPPIPKKMRAEAMQKNNGICMDPSGCTSKGVICEHVVPWRVVLEHKLENLEPRCKVHADAKTSSEHDIFRRSGASPVTRSANGPRPTRTPAVFPNARSKADATFKAIQFEGILETITPAASPGKLLASQARSPGGALIGQRHAALMEL